MRLWAQSSISEDTVMSNCELCGPFGWVDIQKHRQCDVTLNIVTAGLAVLRRLIGLSPPIVLLWIPAMTAAAVLPAPALAKWFAPQSMSEPSAVMGDILARHFVLTFAEITMKPVRCSSARISRNE